MALRLYMDHNIHGAVVRGLRRRGVDVITAYEDGMRRAADHRLLDRASSLDRVLVTADDDLVTEGARRQREGPSSKALCTATSRCPSEYGWASSKSSPL